MSNTRRTNGNINSERALCLLIEKKKHGNMIGNGKPGRYVGTIQNILVLNSFGLNSLLLLVS